MSKTLAQMASRVLRNLQIPEDSTTPSTQALADAKQYLNEAHHDVWGKRVWRESLILGTYSVPASTTQISLSSIVPDSGYSTSGNGYNAVFTEVLGIREGTIPYTPQDATSLNALDVTAWTRTTSPISFTNRGNSGIELRGQFTTATTLSFLGKADSQDLSDSETWILDAQGAALIAKAVGDMIRDIDRDDNRAQIRYQEFAAEIQALIDQQEAQGANIKRIVPVNPWTSFGNEYIETENTTTGFSSIYP